MGCWGLALLGQDYLGGHQGASVWIEAVHHRDDLLCVNHLQLEEQGAPHCRWTQVVAERGACRWGLSVQGRAWSRSATGRSVAVVSWIGSVRGAPSAAGPGQW